MRILLFVYSACLHVEQITAVDEFLSVSSWPLQRKNGYEIINSSVKTNVSRQFKTVICWCRSKAKYPKGRFATFWYTVISLASIWEKLVTVNFSKLAGREGSWTLWCNEHSWKNSWRIYPVGTCLDTETWRWYFDGESVWWTNPVGLYLHFSLSLDRRPTQGVHRSESLSQLGGRRNPFVKLYPSLLHVSESILPVNSTLLITSS